MKFLIRIILLASCLLIPVFSSQSFAEDKVNELSEAEKRGGWTLLFDGKTTNGWRNYKAEKISGGWVVKDGAIERVEKNAGDIVTSEQYENFELSLEYRISKGGNSGVMFHVTEDGAQPWHSGPEVQVQDNVDGRDPQKAGWLYQLYTAIQRTALHSVLPGHKVLIKAAKEGNLELIRQQVEKGVNIDSIDFPTGTALCAAAENNQIEAAKVLIELGADLEKTDDSPMPMTALFKAVSNGHFEMASLLLAHGADPNAMFLTWSSTPRNCLEFLKSRKLENTSLYKLLLNHGAELPTYIKMVEKYPEKASYIAKAVVSAKHFDDAIELTTYLIEKQPNSTLHYQRGVAYDMTKNQVAALSDFDAAIALDSANYQAFYSRALVKRKLGRLQESVADLEVAVKLNPSDAISLNALACELLRTDDEATRDPERSVNLANAACELSDWNDTICIATLAEAYRQTGNKCKALEMDHKVAELQEREALL